MTEGRGRGNSLWCRRAQEVRAGGRRASETRRRRCLYASGVAWHRRIDSATAVIAPSHSAVVFRWPTPRGSAHTRCVYVDACGVGVSTYDSNLVDPASSHTLV